MENGLRLLWEEAEKKGLDPAAYINDKGGLDALKLARDLGEQDIIDFLTKKQPV